MIIPLRDGSSFDISPFIGGFKAKYPHIQDMDAELAKMHLWLHRNPARHPSKPFIFVENWLKKLTPKMIKLHIAAGGKLSEHELIAAGQRLGIVARPGESWVSLAKRIGDAQEKSA